MAASLADIHPKRKLNELDDITNNDYNKKKPHYEKKYLQQRSPSPSDTSSPPKVRPRTKSVLFDVAGKHYQNSPLLTPKDEDDDDSDSTHHHLLIDDSHDLPFNDSPNDISNLDTNPDYIALTSSLLLLERRRDRIADDIRNLNNLRALVNMNDKQDVMNFFVKLINKELDLPGHHQVVKAPVVDMQRYHEGLKVDVIKSQSEPSSLFKTVNVFKSSK